MVATAASVDTRVRVERFEKVIAMVRRASEFCSVDGISPVLRAFLWLIALATRVVNSAGVRSAMDRR